MDEKKQGASEPASDASKEPGEDARCGEGMKQAMAEMIENCGGCCEDMMGMFSRRRRARRDPDSPAAKA